MTDHFTGAGKPIDDPATIVERKISFTDESTGARHEFNGLSELVMAYLKALPVNKNRQELLRDMRCQVECTHVATMPIPLYERIKETL